MLFHYIKHIFIMIIIFRTCFHGCAVSSLSYNSNWEVVERIAEEFPYVVALLDSAEDYICTGTVIDRRTIVTSGTCVNNNPYFVTMTALIFRSRAANNTLIKIAYTRLHRDYIHDVGDKENELPRLHSNIGIVFTVQAVLENYIEAAKLGTYFAPELKDKTFMVVGYGRNKKSKSIILQRQVFHQIACINPKWYYCTCGIEYSEFITYEAPFGEGGPVLLDDEIIGIAADPCGSLTLKVNVKFNIFTIIAPYVPWIEKTKAETIHNLEMKMKSGVEEKVKKCETLIMILLLVTIINM